MTTKKNERGFTGTFILLVIVGLVILVGTSYFFGVNKIGTNITIPTPIVSPSPADSLAPTGDLTNWKTYTNESIKYSILYPPTWQVEQIGAEEGVNQKLVDEKNNSILFIISTNNTDHLSLKNSYKARSCYEMSCDALLPSEQTVLESKVVKVGGQDVLEVNTSLGNNLKKYYFFENSTVITMIRIETDNKIYIDNINQILSTFKFTK